MSTASHENDVASAFSDRAVRREGDKEMPLGPKAQRTRAAILRAAAELFARDGYQRTTVADVAAAAGVSLGTVYQYFRDRADLVAALVHHNVTRMLERTDTAWRVEEGADGLRRVLTNFVDTYAEAGAVAGIWEEVSHVDDELGHLRRTLGRAFTKAVEREIRRAAKADLVRRDVDPAMAAVALTGMVDRYCYVTYVFDPPAGGPPSAEHAAEVLTRLWAGAIGMEG
jgi:AcrR family transcriptional regulator